MAHAAAVYAACIAQSPQNFSRGGAADSFASATSRARVDAARMPVRAVAVEK